MNNFWTKENLISLLFVILFSLISLVVSYYGFGAIDNNSQIPLVKRVIDENYLTNDWYVNSFSSSFNIRDIFAHFLAILDNLFKNLEYTYLFVMILYYVAFAVSIFLLSKYIFKNTKTALISVLVVLLGYRSLTLGGDHLVFYHLVPSAIAMTLSSFALYFFFGKKFLTTFILLAFAACFQIIIAFQVGLVLILIYFLKKPIKIKIIGKKLLKILPLIIVLILLSVPIYLQNQGAESSDAFVEILVRYRAATQWFPSEFNFRAVENFLLLFFALIVLFYAKEKIKREDFIIIKFIIISLFLFALQLIFTKLIPLEIFFVFKFFRLSVFLLLFFYLYLSDEIRQSFSAKNIFFIVFSLIIFISIILVNVFALALIFYMLVVLIKKKKIIIEKIKSSKFHIVILFLISTTLLFFIYLLIVFPLLSGQGISYFANFNLELNLKNSAIFFLFLTGIILLLPQIKIKKSWPLLIILTIILFYLIVKNPLIDRFKPYQASNDFYQYIKNNTEKDLIFLVPTSFEEFRLQSERAVVVDFKSFPLDNENLMIEWEKRITNVNQFYSSPDIEKLDDLEKKYKIDYIIANNELTLNQKLEKIYQNDFVLYKIID